MLQLWIDYRPTQYLVSLDEIKIEKRNLMMQNFAVVHHSLLEYLYIYFMESS